MLKQIVGMSLYTIAIMYAIAFGGEHFYPEADVEWRFDRPSVPYVYPGRLLDWDGKTELWKKYESAVGSSRHYTNVFNVFVVMMIFNMFNTRKINDEKNVFSGLFQNPYFLGVWMLIVGGQVIIVEFGDRALKVSRGGLPWQHWLIAIGCGISTWVIHYLLTLIPDSFCPSFGIGNTQL